MHHQRRREHRGCTARPWPQPTMESEPEFLAKTQRSQAAKKRREPNLEFLRLGSFASLREKSCSKNKKLRTCITDTTNIWFGASCHEKDGDYDKLSSCHATTLQLPLRR